MSRKTVRKILTITALLLICILCSFGCQEENSSENSISISAQQTQQQSVYLQYTPVKIDIIPLTRWGQDAESGQNGINLYVSMIDSFGSQVKSPCIFRFELYQKLQRSADAKGSRDLIWPDVNLHEPAVNNQYWRNFLRAYEFSLPFEPQNEQSYILEVTCICPNEKRLTADYILDFVSESAD